MTIRRNPNRGSAEARDAFVEQASADEKKRLHCFIPAGLHRQLKVMAFDQETDMTVLVVEALKAYVAQRQS